MKRKLSFLLVPIAVLAGASAYAGLKNPSRPATAVNINTTTRHAYGAMGAVTNSTNTSERMLCGLQGMTGIAYAVCAAHDSAGIAVSCSTTNEAVFKAVMGLRSDSYLAFDWDTAGVCTQVVVSVGSYFPTRNDYTTP